MRRGANRIGTRVAALALATLATLATTAGAQAPGGRPPAPTIRIGERAMAFELPRVDGRPFDLASRLPDTAAKRPGRVVVLVWWSATSPAVAKVDPVLAALAKRFASRAEFLAVNPFACRGDDRFGAESAASVRVFKRLRGLDFPVLIDEPRDVTRRYGVTRVPSAVVIDAAGIVRYRGAIRTFERRAGRRVVREDLGDAIDAVVRGATVARSEVGPEGTVIPYPGNPAIVPPRRLSGDAVR